nr:MAG TPA: hypothetical protein [Caudoviricetes sp.]
MTTENHGINLVHPEFNTKIFLILGGAYGIC